MEGANHADDLQKLVADRVAKRNGTWHMTRQHKGDENAGPQSCAVLQITNKLRLWWRSGRFAATPVRTTVKVGAETRNILVNLDCQYPVNDEYAERHQSRSLASAASIAVPGFSSE